MRLPFAWSRNRHRLYLALAAAVVAMLVTSGIVLAHANLDRSEPPAGASLPTAPDHVQLWFTEDLEPGFSEVVVYDANRERVDQGDTRLAQDDPRSLVVSLKSDLPKGSYAIAWKALSKVDGHLTRGIVPFTVGIAGAVSTASVPTSVTTAASSGSPMEMALRWLMLLSSTALVGAFIFWAIQRDVFGRFAGVSRADGILTGQLVLAGGAALAAVLSSFAVLLDQAAIAADVSLIGALGAPIIQTLMATHSGSILGVRVFLGLVLGALLFVRSRSRTASAATAIDRLGMVVGAGLLASISLTSHSAAIATLTPLAITNDWLHLLGVAVWVGGLLQLGLLIASVPRLIKDKADRAAFLGTLVPRFSTIAGVSLAVLVVTGAIEALLHVGNLENLLGDGYGQALLVKLLLVLPLVALAAVNHFFIRPVLWRGRINATPLVLRRVREVAGLLAWTVRIEALLAIGVIAVVGVMTSLSPAQQVGGAGTSGPLSLSAQAGQVVITLGIAPGIPGPNRYVVDVRDASGQAIASVEHVSVRLRYLDSDVGEAETMLSSTGRGRFEGQSSDLAVAGRWQADVLVRRAGQDDAIGTFRFDVTAEGARTLGAPALQFGWSFYLGLIVVVAGAVAAGRGIALRLTDLRRAIAVVLCGVALLGIGAVLTVREVQSARAQMASDALARMYPATPESIANGAAVFRESCAVCHGLDARGDGPLAATLTPRPSNLVLHVPMHPDAELVGWIADGFPGSAMPAFRTTLTEQERWDVVNYLKSLASGAVSSAPPMGTATSAAMPASGGAHQGH